MSYLLLLLLHDVIYFFFFFSSRRRHTRLQGDWSSDVCSSDLCIQRIHHAPPASALANTPHAAPATSPTTILVWSFTAGRGRAAARGCGARYTGNRSARRPPATRRIAASSAVAGSGSGRRRIRSTRAAGREPRECGTAAAGRGPSAARR